MVIHAPDLLCLHPSLTLPQALHGVTNDLRRRLREHREGTPGSFTQRYRIDRLVSFEVHSDVRVAIAREKEVKDWTREKRMRLIEGRNAGWLDLGADW